MDDRFAASPGDLDAPVTRGSHLDAIETFGHSVRIISDRDTLRPQPLRGHSGTMAHASSRSHATAFGTSDANAVGSCARRVESRYAPLWQATSGLCDA